MGHLQQFADICAGIFQHQLASRGLGGHVTGKNRAQTGAVHEMQVAEVNVDVFALREQLLDLRAEQFGGLARLPTAALEHRIAAGTIEVNGENFGWRRHWVSSHGPPCEWINDSTPRGAEGVRAILRPSKASRCVA